MIVKLAYLTSVVILATATQTTAAEVTVTELGDRIRFEVDGHVFTEWRHKDWVAPYLYPLVGPSGDNLTRHFPMKPGVDGEEQDHPWHRSIRFSHSDVNGFNFWWAPGKERAGHTAEIRLEKIERLTSGESGDAIFWNVWLGDGKLILREKVRLSVAPLANRETLLDYDTELHAVDAPVDFGDKRDGGLLVRVASTMKVEDEQGNKLHGTIVNSRGDRNADAWGKQAEWTDYCGPDAHGKTVGIAMFDHPSNLRFPTHWHVRTYGLMSANRFGADHFKGNYGDHKTVICRPSPGANCPACASHSGDYTIPAGKSLALRQRFFFHHGDTQAANVAKQYRQYTADPAATVALMRAMMQQYRSSALVEQFGGEDFTAWPAEFAAQTNDALRLRAAAYSVVKQGKWSEADYELAIQRNPSDPVTWIGLADNYANVLNDGKQAVAAYRRVLDLTGKTGGWMPLYATIAIARDAIDRVKPDEAIELLKQYDGVVGVAPVWRIKILRTYGHAYAAQGNEEESLARFREALELESQAP